MRSYLVLILLALGLMAVVPATATAHPRRASAARIAFVRAGDIWTIAGDGSQLLRVTSGKAVDSSPVWCPSRRTIAFVRAAAQWGDPPSICLVPAGGGAAHRLRYETLLGNTAFRFMNGLAYSPDGKKLAFSDMYEVRSGKPERNRLGVISLKSGRTTVLINHRYGFDGAMDAGWPLSWSPDGESLLVAQWGMDSEGGETHVFDIPQRRLYKLPVADASWASWAPDGQAIVLSTATQQRTSIVLANPSGAVQATLVEGGGWDASPDAPPVEDACFSASGSQIAYVVLSPEDGTRSLWIMDADGSGQHRLTTGDSPAWR